MKSNIEKQFIAIDLDNTLIDYSLSYSNILKSMKIDLKTESKEKIKRILKSVDDNDYCWRKFQSSLYTVGLNWAKIATGFNDFKILLMNSFNIEFYYVSHKDHNIDLISRQDSRKLSTQWLISNSILVEEEIKSRLFYCDSVRHKIDTILSLNPIMCIDDLKTVLEELRYSNILKVHYKKNVRQFRAKKWYYEADFIDLTTNFRMIISNYESAKIK